MYSFENKLGRIKYYDGIEDNSFYWNDETGERFWTKPYTCLMENIEFTSYTGTNIFNSWFNGFEKLFTYTRTYDRSSKSYFYGLLGLMANAQHLTQKRMADVHLFSVENIKKLGRCWTVDIDEASLKFIFELVGEKIDLIKILSPQPEVRSSFTKAYEAARLSPLVKFSAESLSAAAGTKMAITVLRRDFDRVTSSDLALPEGFGCSRYCSKTDLFKPIFTHSYPGLVYNMEATLFVMKNQVKSPTSTYEWSFDDKFNDDEIAIHYTTMSFKMIDDSTWKTMSIVYESGSGSERYNQARLVSWDLNSLIRSDVSVARQECTQWCETSDSTDFATSLEFPDGSRLILTGDARRIMSYYDRNFSPHLLDDTTLGGDFIEMTGTNTDDKFGFKAKNSDWAILSYEADTLGYIKLYTRGELMNQSETALVRKFLYNRRTLESTPISVDVYFYSDSSRTKRVAQIHVNILSIDTLNHWTRPNNLIDLSACYKNKPRRSAMVSIEFPLNDGYPNMRDLLEPHFYIRKSLASFFRGAFDIHETRMSSIDIEIEHDYLIANIRLLDKPSFNLYSKKMQSKQVDSFDKEFQIIQKMATFTTLTNDALQCGDYCESYKCSYYVFCSHNQNCLLLHSSTFDTKGVKQQDSGIGSFYDVGQTCVAYQVSSSIYNKNQGWRLEDILAELDKYNPALATTVAAKDTSDSSDDVPHDKDFIEPGPPQNSYGQRERNFLPTLTMVMQSRMASQLSATVTLVASKISHHWDDPGLGSSYLNLDGLPSEISSGDQYSNKVSQSIKFRIIVTNRRFKAPSITNRPSESGSDENSDELVDGNLDVNGGVTVIKHQEYEDCARMCLNDYSCYSFSYCHHDRECILTSNSDYSRIKSDNNEEITQNDKQCSIVGRNYLDMFRRSATKLSPSEQSFVIDKKITLSVSSALDCATSCVNNDIVPSSSAETVSTLGKSNSDTKSKQFKCLSFDFCSAPTEDGYNCVLYDKHFVSSQSAHDHVEDVNNVNKKDNNDNNNNDIRRRGTTGRKSRVIFCTHHSRLFLVDFNKIHKRRLPLSMVGMTTTNEAFVSNENNNEQESSVLENDINQETMGQPTIERCARLCEEDQNCGAFEFCLAIKKSSGKHFTSCSIGNNRTLELIGENSSDEKQTKTVRRLKQQEALSQLSSSEICSIYAYGRLSFVIAKRKKNTQYLLDELVKEKIANKWWLNARMIFRFDVLVFIITLMIGVLMGRKRDHLYQLRELYNNYQRSLMTPDDGYSDAIVDQDYNEQTQQDELNDQSKPDPSILSSANADENLERNFKTTLAPNNEQTRPKGLKMKIFSIEEQRKASLTSLTDNIAGISEAGGELMRDVDDNQL